ncbi:hypothetical protein A3731_40935 [Roseovarius sp. HI0049]|nr:hypothetical protein A3731_41015 [Roseovarius sp. HI0049]KZY38094.1 hypothetical protein A3731_40935 [Roseovarius sp. HI0049]
MGLNLEQDISFSTFIDLLHEHRAERGKWNRHWRPQSRILKPHIINYTLIGKFEQFEQDFERLNSYLDGVLPALVQRAPHKTQAQDRIAHFYTPALKQKVEEIYAKDFEGFGYQYNLTQTITKRPD